MEKEVIKVLQVNAENFGAGGISVIIWRLMTELGDKNVRVGFLAQNRQKDKRYVDIIEAQEGKVHYIETHSNIFIRYIDRYFKCLKLLRENKYDIVHINGNEALGIISFVLAAKHSHSCKVVVHAHSTKFMNKEYLWIKKALKTFLQPIMIHNIDCMLACSSEAAKFMYGKDAGKSIIIKNGLKYEQYAFDSIARNEVRRKMLNHDKVVIGHIGRFVYAKNHEFILKVFEKISMKYIEAELWLIGEQEGEIYQQVLGKIKKSGLQDKIKFCGVTENVQDYLSSMDVLVFPSRFEGLPLVLVEAQANGLPVVCSDVITQEAIFANNVKKLSLNDDVELWADEVMRLGKLKRTGMDYEKFKNSGFDIEQNANVLGKEYKYLKNKSE